MFQNFRKDPYECLIIFLNSIAPNVSKMSKASSGVETRPQVALKPQIPVKKSSDFESPALCSTRISTSENDVVVSEVRHFIKF